jgi:disulfide bond formation protein DsbB
MQEVQHNVTASTSTAQDINEPTASASAKRGRIIGLLSQASYYIALLVVWVAMCGSLFFSEVWGWLPCVLCWYQRILMYPLALILPIGILRRDTALHLYVLPFSLIGAGVSLYHYVLVKTDLFPEPPCNINIPCTVEYLNLLGFINIPLLALTAFLLTSLMAALATLNTEASTTTDEAAEPPRRAAWLAPLLRGLAVTIIIAGVVGVFVYLGTLAA